MYKNIRSSCFFLSFLYKLLAFSFAFVIYCPVIASAAQVTLEWDENSEADLAGYRVFCRQDGQDYDYYNPVWEGTEPTCTIFDLNDNTTYYFVARAVDILGNESDNSNEVFSQFEDLSGTCTDADDDGYYSGRGCGTVVDCNDNDPSINPGATEICDDNKDNDCNGLIDCSDPNCDCDIPNDDANSGGPADDLIVSDLAVSSGEDYEVVDYGLVDGAFAYIDRSYRFTDIPVYLEGATFIKTANDDKMGVGDDFLSFDVNQDVTVYVAHDDFVKDKPSWLLDFTDTGDQLVTTDKSLSIYARDFSAGTITLGGNDGPGNSMYVVVLVGR